MILVETEPKSGVSVAKNHLTDQHARRAWAFRRWLRLSVGLTVLGVLLAPHQALADPYPVDGGPDGGKHRFCLDKKHKMAKPVRQRAVRPMARADAQTHASVKRQTSCGPHSDVRFQQRYIGADIYGYSPCARRAAGGVRCDARQVRIYWAEIKRDANYPKRQARKTLCHEVGHTLGLNHYRSWVANPDGYWAPHSCMISGIHDHGDARSRSFGAHHVAHINRRF